MLTFRPVFSLLCIVGVCAAQTPQTAPEQQVRASFRVRYVASGSVYVEGGRSAGLAEGTKLVIKAKPAAMKPEQNTADSASYPSTTDSESAGIIANLKVVSVADTSAVCEIVSSTRPIIVGDVVTLPQDEVEKLIEKHALSSTRQYPAVVSFTEGDPLDEELRDAIPKPPLPEINQARGRIGLDFSTTRSASVSSLQLGFVFRADITRINGTYWNLSGYYRGGFTSVSSQSRPSLQDLINRTYHMTLTYDNPNSRWLAGFGRMYLPWASSLDTIDGGYFGRRLSHGGVAGVFAGMTPDPTSWSYDPNRRIGGTFVSYDGGSFDQVKWTTTTGIGLNLMGWQINRPFLFGEETVSYKRTFSLYYSFQVDRPRTDPSLAPVALGIGRSLFSFRVQPHPRVSFDLNDTYFRDVPTFDAQLVGTGLLDKYLFQGLSAGVRVEAPRHLTLYTNVGRSSSSRDTKASWNTMFGVSLGQIWKTGVRADLRYSKFDSAFGKGAYRSVALSRAFGDDLRFTIQGGTQSFFSSLVKDSGSHFVNATVDYSFSRHYFLEGGFTMQRGGIQNYNQSFATFGYRFDNRWRKKQEVADVPHD